MVNRTVPLIRLYWSPVDAILKSERVCCREGRGLSGTRGLLHRAVAARCARCPTSRRRLRHSVLPALVRRLLRRVARSRSVLAVRGTLRRIRRILGVVPVVNARVVTRRGCLRRALHVYWRLSRSGRRVRVGHRRRVRIMHMRLARSGHKLGLARMRRRARRRVLGVGAIGRGSGVVSVRRWVRRIGVGMRGRMCRVDSLTGHVVVYGAFDGAGNGRSSSSRVGRPPGLGRKMDAIMLLQVILSGTPGLASWERALVVPLPSVYTSMPRKVAARGEWPGARRADVLLLGLLGCSSRGGRARRRWSGVDVTLGLILVVRLSRGRGRGHGRPSLLVLGWGWLLQWSRYR